MEWPGYDKDELFGLHKVINEPDFLPLHFIRVLTQAAKLFRTYRGKLVMTPLGRKILEGEQHGPLQALLFHVAFSSPFGSRLRERDRWFADSPLEETGFEPLVPLRSQHNRGAGPTSPIPNPETRP
jgi:hypothetical protein